MPIIVTQQEDARVEAHVAAIRAILEADLFEDQMGKALRDYCQEHLTDIELGAEVHDALSTRKIISKPNFRALWNK